MLQRQPFLVNLPNWVPFLYRYLYTQTTWPCGVLVLLGVEESFSLSYEKALNAMSLAAGNLGLILSPDETAALLYRSRGCLPERPLQLETCRRTGILTP